MAKKKRSKKNQGKRVLIAVLIVVAMVLLVYFVINNIRTTGHASGGCTSYISCTYWDGCVDRNAEPVSYTVASCCYSANTCCIPSRATGYFCFGPGTTVCNPIQIPCDSKIANFPIK